MWNVDVSTGIVSFPTVAKRYEAEHAKLSGRAGEDSHHPKLFHLIFFLMIKKPFQIVATAPASVQFMGVSSIAYAHTTG